MPNEKNLKKLTRLLAVMDEDSLTRVEFETAFKKVLEFVIELKKKNKLVQDNLTSLFNKRTIELVNANSTKISKLEIEFRGIVNKALNEQENGLNFLRDKVRSIQDGLDGLDGRDGKDADEKKIVKKVLSQIKFPETPEKVLGMEDIEGLIDKIEEVKLAKRVGGGFSKIHMDGHIIDDETPTGTVNSSNKIFTVAKAPNPTGSLKVFVNGMRMKITEDYTLSGITITFTTAPPTGSILLVDYRK